MSGGYEARTRDLLNSIIEVDQINAQQRAVLQSGEPVSRPRAAEDVGQALRPSPPGPAGPGGAMVGRRVRACLNPPDAYPISRCACDGIAWTRCGGHVTGLLSGAQARATGRCWSCYWPTPTSGRLQRPRGWSPSPARRLFCGSSPLPDSRRAAVAKRPPPRACPVVPTGPVSRSGHRVLPALRLLDVSCSPIAVRQCACHRQLKVDSTRFAD